MNTHAEDQHLVDLWSACQRDIAFVSLDGKSRARTEVHEAGEIDLLDGHLVVFDPLSKSPPPSFDRAVEANWYPMNYAVLDHHWIAATMVDLRSGPPVEWERAQTQEATPARHGFRSLSGVGCYCSERIAKRLRRLGAETGLDEFRDRLHRALLDNQVDAWKIFDLEIIPRTEGNLIVFSTGVGEGLYSSWWGLNEAHQPTCLLTDMGLLDEARRSD